MNVDLSLGSFVGLNLAVDSNVSDYLTLTDTSNQRSNYIIGSHVGGTADGLNIWDDSGQTMLVSFSKQSIRFYQNVVGPVFDVGGALADTYNVATFGVGTDPVETRIQSAINQASIDGVSRVYVPANMYPYSTSSVSFIGPVQMVREGGDWSVYDALAYGINGDGVTDHTAHLQSLESVRPVNAVVRLSKGTYLLSESHTTMLFRILTAGTYDFRGATIRYGGTANLTNGSDGGGVGLINVLADNVRLDGGILDGNNKAKYLLTRKGDTVGCGFFGSIRSTITTNGQWPGIHLRASADIAGAGSYAGHNPGRTLYGFLNRPDCPMVDTNDSVTTYNNVTAVILGGDRVTGENTGVAIVMGDAYGVNFARMDKVGIMTSAKPLEGNDHWLDARVHDLDCNTFELHGDSSQAIQFGYPAGAVWGQFIKSGANTGWFDYNVFSGKTVFPNVNISGGSAYQDGRIEVFGKILPFDGSTTTAPYSWRSEASLGFYRSGNSVMGLSYGQLALPIGSANTPAIGFTSETSLGLYRSAVSTLAVSYGTFQFASQDRPESINIRHVSSGNWRIGKVGTNTGNLTISTDSGAMQVGAGVGANLNLQTNGGVDRLIIRSGGTAEFVNALYAPSGTAILPSIAFSSELSLGWDRSAASVMALSYGGLGIAAGTNASCGTAVLGSNGSVNVATTYVKTGDLIFLTDQTPGGTLGDLEILGIRNASGFTIASTGLTDTSTVAWLIIRPG